MESKSCADWLKDVIPDVRAEVLKRLGDNGISTTADLLLCDKGDLRDMGFNLMEANRILRHKDGGGSGSTAAVAPAPGKRGRSGSLAAQGNGSALDPEVDAFVSRWVPAELHPRVRGELGQLPLAEQRGILALGPVLGRVGSPASIILGVLRAVRERVQGPAPAPAAAPAASRHSRGSSPGGRRRRKRRCSSSPPARKRRRQQSARSRKRRRNRSSPAASPASPERRHRRKRSRSRSSRSRSGSSRRSGSLGRSRSTSLRKASIADSELTLSLDSRRSGSRSSSGATAVIDSFIDARIIDSGWDDRVRKELRAMRPRVVKSIVGPKRVPELRRHQNPTAAVLQRLKEARASMSVMEFAGRHGLADGAVRSLQRLNPAARSWVMGKDLTTARDATSVIIARCAEVARSANQEVLRNYWHQMQLRDRGGRIVLMREQSQSRSPSPWRERERNPAAKAIQQFAKQWDLDRNCLRHLRMLDPAGAETVIEHSQLSGKTKSPIAVVTKGARQLLTTRETYLLVRDGPKDFIGIDFTGGGSCKIREVMSGTPAARAGIPPGVTVVAVDGVAVSSASEAKRLSENRLSLLVTISTTGGGKGIV
eukprot:TRINITY_DN4803_c2_g1_i1.p1 TRINITY_DN4803_c2_g1~~TRINITY_DN4803_c2_g1_i1.p1  ORF type:complete len:596 (+),score=156.75 TRINITY_DN4803_c2_g1_i1:71-1858(+)